MTLPNVQIGTSFGELLLCSHVRAVQANLTHNSVSKPPRRSGLMGTASARPCGQGDRVITGGNQHRHSGSGLPQSPDVGRVRRHFRFVPKAAVSRCSNQSVCRSQIYSITSSARASRVGGTSRPSAFAVLRLITSSYLVGA